MTLRSIFWPTLALVFFLVLVVVNSLSSLGYHVRGTFLLPVVILALRSPPTLVAGAGVAAVFTALFIPVEPDQWSQTIFAGFVVAIGSAIAVKAAAERTDAAAARAGNRERFQILAQAAQITDAGGSAQSNDATLVRLVELLVPYIGDAAWIDVLERDGGTRRVVALVDAPDGSDRISKWLANQAPPGPDSPTARTLAGEGPQMLTITDEVRAKLDATYRAIVDGIRLHKVMSLPIHYGSDAIGALGIAVGHSGRELGPNELAVAQIMVDRAGLAFTNMQLVGQLTATQQRLDGILGSLGEAVVVRDQAGENVYTNAAATRLFASTNIEELLSSQPAAKPDRHSIYDEAGNPVQRSPYEQALSGATPEPLLTQVLDRQSGDRRWFITVVTPLDDGSGERLAVGVINEVTDQQESVLREQFLSEASQTLSTSLDVDETLRTIADLAVPRLADSCIVELPDERGRLRPVAVASPDGRSLEYAQELLAANRAAGLGSEIVVESGIPIIYPKLTDATRRAVDLDDSGPLGLKSVLILPMRNSGRTLGTMTFSFIKSDRKYGERDIAFLSELAQRSATAIENARLYTERSEVATTLQANLLPDELPNIPGWQLYADYRAGQQGTDVGGDFYEIIGVPSGYIFVLGDVTGKGVRAAALTSLVRYTARTAAAFDPSPSSVLSHVNRALRERPRLAPVTMVCGRLDKHGFTLAVGGHPLPLLKDREGVREVGIPGTLLGAVSDYAPPTEIYVDVAAGDTVLLYTDGVTDLAGPSDRFGLERLIATAEAAPHSPADLVGAIDSTLDEFADGSGNSDDRAMLALRRI